MTEFWIKQHASGNVRGPVTSAQLKILANQGELKPTDEIGNSREGPWNRADGFPGLPFPAEAVESGTPAGPSGQPPLHFKESAPSNRPAAGAQNELPDFDSLMQGPAPPQQPAPAEPPATANEVVHIRAGLSKKEDADAGASKDDDAKGKAPSLIGTFKESMRLKSDRSDNKYPALRMIARAHQRMGVVCLFLAAVSLCAFFYFLISYATTHRTPAKPAVEPNAVDLDDFADQLQQQLLQASAEIENVTYRAKAVTRILGSLIMTFSLGWGAILCFAFAQIITLVLEIERNTRKEREETEG